MKSGKKAITMKPVIVTTRSVAAPYVPSPLIGSCGDAAIAAGAISSRLTAETGSAERTRKVTPKA
jgi:hypothetical protein